MAALITMDELLDLVNTTRSTIDKGKITEIATDEEEHIVLPELFKKESVKKDPGTQIDFDAIYRAGANARNIGYYDRDQTGARDVTVKGNVRWARTVTSVLFDKMEIWQNSSSRSRIQDHVKTRAAAEWLGLSNLMEQNGSSVPASDDGITPFGIKYWLTKKITGSSAATSTGEFGGGNPTNFSSGAGAISSTTYPAWANWTQAYAQPSADDLVDKMVVAAYRTGFKSPIATKINEAVRAGRRRKVYCPFLIRRGLEKVADARNENLGRDLASGEVMFKRNPIIAWPMLDDDSDDPVYMIDWQVFDFVQGRGMEGPSESETHVIAGMSQCVGYEITAVWQTLCVNRRKNAVLTKAADND